MLDDEQIGWAQAEHDDWVSVQAIAHQDLNQAARVKLDRRQKGTFPALKDKICVGTADRQRHKRRRAQRCGRLRWVRATSCTSLAYCHLLTASECVERECGLCRPLRKAANRGGGNCVPSRPR